jgi:hypothetical protein
MKQQKREFIRQDKGLRTRSTDSGLFAGFIQQLWEEVDNRPRNTG